MQNGSTTLILGGGVGGIVTARLLREALPPPHRIVLIDREADVHLGATKTWVALGLREAEQVVRPRDALARAGIDLRLGEVQSIDARHRVVRSTQGELAADYLVLALGATPRWSAVAGLEEAAHTFYTLSGAVRMREAIRDFQGGRILVLVAGQPFPCPPAPYEGAMLLRDHFESGPGRGRVRVDVCTAEKAPMGTAGPEMGAWIRAALAERGIGFFADRRPERVDAKKRAVLFADGSEESYDLLVAVPPFTGAGVVRESGLANEAGWIPVDRSSLRMMNVHEPDRTFAIGDCAAVPLPGRYNPDVPLSLPKAGAFAEGGAKVVAARIAAHVRGAAAPEAAFDGRGTCFIEMGGGLAARGDGMFFEMPHPRMAHKEPSTELAGEKKEALASWMDTYL
jgi:sulfide:quinone oxidoreductase